MRKTKILLGVILMLVSAFIGFKVFKLETLAEYVRPIILPLLTIYYCSKHNDKYSYFFYFLLFFSLSELFSAVPLFGEPSYIMYDLMYYGCNILNIFAYVFLILEITKSLSLKKVFSKFAFLILILIGSSIYTVKLVSDVAEKSEFIVTIYEYYMEFTYNAVIMILLAVALLNYLYRDSNKSMTLLVGSLSIVFSEVIQVAYFYVAEILFLDILYSVLLVIAFVFFYIQANMQYGENRSFKEESIKELEEV